MKVLVTGGTGFLGRQLVQRLVERGDSVRMIHRPSSDLSGLPESLEKVHGDVTDPATLRAAMEGCEGVYHAAALVKTWVRPRSRFDAINVRGTRNVFEAARDTGIGRVVYTSSFFALGAPENPPGDETTTPDHAGWHTDYERTKQEAERVAKEFVAEGQDIVRCYPVLVYGPGPLTEGNYIGQMVVAYVNKNRYKLPGVIGSGEQRWTYSYTKDVIEGHLAAMERGKPGEGYLLGGEDLSLNEFLGVLHEETGVPPPRMKIPFWAARLAAWSEEGLAVAFGKNPTLTREVVGVYEHDWTFRSAKAERDLGYRITPFREGLREILADLKRQGKIG